MKTIKKYKISTDFSGDLIDSNFISIKDIIDTLYIQMDKEGLNFKENISSFEIETMLESEDDWIKLECTCGADEDDIRIEIYDYELTKEEFLKAEIIDTLKDNNCYYNVASTGTIYVNADFKVIDSNGEECVYEGIRISDHDANGKNSYFEIDTNKVKDIDKFISALDGDTYSKQLEELMEFASDAN